MKGKRVALTAILLIVFLLVGFQSFASGQKDQGKEAKTAEISIMYGTPWKEFVEPAVASFEKETGIKVNQVVLPPGTNPDQKVALDLAGGVASDIIAVDGYRIPEFAEAGYLLSLDSYLNKWPDWNSYYSSMKKMVSFDGRSYGIPLDTDVRMLWYWKPIFEKAGIAMPWEPKNWDDVNAAAMKIKKALPNVEYPIYIPAGSKMGEATTMQGFYMLLLGADTPDNDRNKLRDWKSGKWIGKSPALLRALQEYQLIFVKDKLSLKDIYYTPDVWGDWRRAMIGGNIGIGLGGSWEFKEFWSGAGADVPSVEERKKLVGWAPMPGAGVSGAPEIVSISGGWTFAVNAKTKDADASWKLLETIFSKDNFGGWVAGAAKVSTRRDVSEMPAYQKDDYVAAITKLVKYTATRDTYPGYSKVSSCIQSATEDILDGKSPEEAMDSFYNNLVSEFGKDKVTIIK